MVLLIKNTIDWTVSFNKNLSDIKNPTNDSIQDGQVFQEGSIKVYKLITHLDDSLEYGGEVTTRFTTKYLNSKNTKNVQ